MKTKVTILGQAEAVKPELKKIEFVKYLDKELDIKNVITIKPSDCDNIELISSDYKGTGFDLMFAYNDGFRNGNYNNCIFIGHFNDGII